ncbi:MAG: GNAT family N-acetyltransferase [Bacteroidales bacterium]|nr:GNAT family N-acetyltransferase [Bacteroidales bacterium]MBN2763338.1 GNAT family N-acetyltransferase [Bacteroidales bacterium]
MNKNGLKHWNNVYPGPDVISDDLAKRNIYLAKDKGVCKGMVTIDRDEPDDYKKIQWPNAAGKPLYLHRLAVHPSWQGQGIAKMLLDFAEDYAVKNGFDALRIDVYSTSTQARNLCVKQSFNEAGNFFSVFQQQPFVCYEKKIG